MHCPNIAPADVATLMAVSALCGITPRCTGSCQYTMPNKITARLIANNYVTMSKCNKTNVDVEHTL